MKRKLAIAMASIMAVSPLTVFAASYNYRSNSVESVPEKTILVEQTEYSKPVIKLSDSATKDLNKDDVEYLASGTDIVIELRDKVQVGDTFKINLTNGEWYFYNTTFGATTARDQVNYAVDINALNATTTTNGAISTQLLTDLQNKVVNTNGSSSTPQADSKKFNPLALTALSETDPTLGDRSKVANYDLRNGMFDGLRTYTRFPVGVSTNSQQDAKEIAYKLEVSRGDQSTAIVTILQTPTTPYNEKILRVPAIIRTTGSGEVKATIDAQNTSISSGTVTLASLGSSSVSASVKDLAYGKYSILVDKLKVTEKYVGTFKKGVQTAPKAVMTLEAPYGYYWADPTKDVKDGNDTVHAMVYLEGLKAVGNKDEIDANDGTVLKYAKTGTGTNAKDDRKKLILNMQFADTSASFPGSIYFDNLVLVAEDFASYDQDIKIKVKDAGDAGSTDFDDVEVVIGQRKDWGITLTNVDDYTKFIIVNGRYSLPDPNTNAGKVATYANWDALEDQADDHFDDNHKTAKIKVQENVSNSWWAGRETTFTLSEGVKFIRVEIGDVDNVNTKIDDNYIPNKAKGTYVSLDANKLSLYDLEIAKDRKAKFEMTSWVSVEPGTEGDITMYLNAITDQDKTVVPSVKIAKAVSPITLTTATKDIKIGLQWQKVSDFTITETAPNMLEKDKTVTIKIDDGTSDSDNIYILPDFIVETNGTDSKIDISKPVVSKGQISFTVERESYGKPATLKFSNVYVKVDRTVPESNNRPYKLVVGGTAIAGNYADVTSNYEPTFSISGLGANYLNVITPADQNETALSKVVRVTIGSDKVSVGRNNPVEMQMDTAAYISTSNSTMVPVRFVSQALGIQENQIKWDNDKRTVTIMTPNKTIQFTVGSSDITVNGSTYTMYTTDNTATKVYAEIKDNRTFLPFRQLGDALGIDVYWDEATKSAIYNYNQTVDANTQGSTVAPVTE